MAVTGFKPDRGWARFSKAIDPRIFKSKSLHHLRRASAQIGVAGESVTRKNLESGSYEANAPLTIAIKRSSLQLADRGALKKAITSKVIDPLTVFLGVLRTDRRYNIALTIHDGSEIKVTQRMRTMFHYLWLKSHDPTVKLTGRALDLWDRFKGLWHKISLSTSVIVIPARPFMVSTFRDPALKKLAVTLWTRAINLTLRELAAK